jgi:hypothetical protein
MFNLDEQQRTIILRTIASAFACWLASQIADSGLFERIWNQVAILALAGSGLRVWILEGIKASR